MFTPKRRRLSSRRNSRLKSELVALGQWLIIGLVFAVIAANFAMVVSINGGI